MGRVIRILLAPALVLLGPLGGAAAAPRVELVDGRVSAEFQDVAVTDAVAAIRQGTGVDLVLPAAAGPARTISFTARAMPLEQFLRRFLDALDLGGFALVFEPDGAVTRVIVVDRGSGAPSPPPAPAPPPPPVYVPPAAPPVYIPPTEEPVYVPPATPPVYVPPAAPPVYVPPAEPPRYIPPS